MIASVTEVLNRYRFCQRHQIFGMSSASDLPLAAMRQIRSRYSSLPTVEIERIMAKAQQMPVAG